MPHQVSARARLRLTGLALAAALLFALIPLARAGAASETPGDTFAVSTAAAGAFANAGTAPPLAISADGRLIVFVSAASNLSPDAPAGVAEVYVKDLDTGAVVLASRADGADGAPAEPKPVGESPVRQIEGALISGDGRYAVFASTARNLAPGVLPLPGEEDVAFAHVFRRDLTTGKTELVDRVDGEAGSLVAADARLAAVSADGRFVLFDVRVEDLEDPAGAHEEGRPTLYMRNLQTGTTTAVGRTTDAGGEPGALADEGSFDGAITPDGRYVLFSSPATNLDPRANGLFQVYRRDLQTGTTVAVSVANPVPPAADGELSDGEAFEPTFLGPDGCRVAFVAIEAANLFEGVSPPPIVATYVRDLCAHPQGTTLASVDPSGQPFAEGFPVGADAAGHLLLKAAGSGEISHLYLRDLAGAATTLLDRATGAGGAIANQPLEGGALAANGCRAAFTSGADNLTPQPPPASGSALQLQAYARQLAPCGPVAEEPEPEDPQVHPLSVRVASIGPRRLWLRFSAAGTATVRVKRVLGHRRLRLVRTLRARARRPETVKLRFRPLPPGRYRFLIVPASQGARHLDVPLRVRSNTLGSPRS